MASLELNTLRTRSPIEIFGDIFSPAFTRRNDLTSEIRLMIASSGLLFPCYGTITDLAEKFSISRTFVYTLCAQLKQAIPFIFSETAGQSTESLREQSTRLILSLRMEGRSSLGGLSTVMRRLQDKYYSAGFASETLTCIGEQLPCSIDLPDNTVTRVTYVSDELFAKRYPILITADPRSSAILRIELLDSRSAADWKQHFDALKQQGIHPHYLVTDEGSGLVAGCEQSFPDVKRQSDTYHAIAHKLGIFVDRLERAALAAIDYEYSRAAVLGSAKTEQVIKKRLAQYEQAKRESLRKIRIYEEFCDIYCCLINEIKLFDKHGNLRSVEQARAGVETCLSLLDSLSVTKLKTIAQQIRDTLPSLFHYFEIAKPIVAKLNELGLDEEAVKLYCLAWQWHKANISAKTTYRRRYAQDQEALCLAMAEGLHQQDFENDSNACTQLGLHIYQQLNHITRSSSLIECINSILRPYLDCAKNQVTQAFLNLFLFYHNHRRYADGERKGKTPMEILTGTVQTEDWIDLLLKKVG